MILRFTKSNCHQGLGPSEQLAFPDTSDMMVEKLLHGAAAGASRSAAGWAHSLQNLPCSHSPLKVMVRALGSRGPMLLPETPGLRVPETKDRVEQGLGRELCLRCV